MPYLGYDLKIDESVAEISKNMIRMDSKLDVIVRVVGGLIVVGTFVVTVGKAVGWF